MVSKIMAERRDKKGVSQFRRRIPTWKVKVYLAIALRELISAKTNP
jgi:hypothetical protein